MSSTTVPDNADTLDAPPQTGGPLAVFWLLYIVAFCHVALRFYSRVRVERRFGADDWLLGTATVQTMIVAGVLTSASHARDLNGTITSQTLKDMLAFEFVYWLAIGALKTSVLWHFFTCARESVCGRAWKVQRVMLVGMLVFTAAQSLAAAFLSVFACHPVSALWELSGKTHQHSTCIARINLIQGTNSAVSSATTITLLVLPFIIQSILRKDQKHPYLRRMCLAAGLFCACAAVLRAVTFFVFEGFQRSKSNSLLLPLFAGVELNLGIIAACIMSYGPFMRRHEINEDPITTPSSVRIAIKKWQEDGALDSAWSETSSRRGLYHAPSTIVRYYSETPKVGKARSVQVTRALPWRPRTPAGNAGDTRKSTATTATRPGPDATWFIPEEFVKTPEMAFFPSTYLSK